MSNKKNTVITHDEVIEEMQAYFLKQDPKDIALMLASLMVDVHQMYYYEYLTEIQVEELTNRCMINSQSVVNFAHGERSDSLEVVVIDKEKKNE